AAKAFAADRPANPLGERNAMLRREPIDDQKAQIVARALVSLARIAEPDDQLHRSGGAPEKPRDQASPSLGASAAAAAAAGASSTVGGTTETNARFVSKIAVTPSGMARSSMCTESPISNA